MQLIDRVELCNGCGACRVACKYQCVKMIENEEGLTRPVVDENGCQKCNACMLFCPLYNPVELPEFETFYDSAEDTTTVYDETTKESQTFYALTAAKKWMKERIKQGHEVRGQKYKVYSDGDFVNCGTISLTGNNKSFVANTRQTKKGY